MSTEDLSHEDIQIYESQLDQARSILTPYNIQKGTFYQWLNEFEYVANLVRIPSHKMVEFLMKMIDDNTFSSENVDLTRAELSLLTYEQLTQKFYYFSSRSCQTSTLHRKRFVKRYQYEKETIKEYINSLERIYNLCDYLVSPNTKLRKQIIKGIRNDEIRAKLQKLRYVRYDVFLEIAEELEAEIIPTLSAQNRLNELQTIKQ